MIRLSLKHQGLVGLDRVVGGAQPHAEGAIETGKDSASSIVGVLSLMINAWRATGVVRPLASVTATRTRDKRLSRVATEATTANTAITNARHMPLILPNPSVHGDKAPIPLASAQEWEKAFPRRPSCASRAPGHFPFIEQPQAFLRAI